MQVWKSPFVHPLHWLQSIERLRCYMICVIFNKNLLFYTLYTLFSIYQYQHDIITRRSNTIMTVNSFVPCVFWVIEDFCPSFSDVDLGGSIHPEIVSPMSPALDTCHLQYINMKMWGQNTQKSTVSILLPSSRAAWCTVQLITQDSNWQPKSNSMTFPGLFQ